jgi:hypothetical protein
LYHDAKADFNCFVLRRMFIETWPIALAAQAELSLKRSEERFRVVGSLAGSKRIVKTQISVPDTIAKLCRHLGDEEPPVEDR